MNLLTKSDIDESAWADLTDGLASLSEADSELCEQPVTYEECIKAINGMADRESPGCDGLPAEFYKMFFSALRDRLCLADKQP